MPVRPGQNLILPVFNCGREQLNTLLKVGHKAKCTSKYYPLVYIYIIILVHTGGICRVRVSTACILLHIINLLRQHIVLYYQLLLLLLLDPQRDSSQCDLVVQFKIRQEMKSLM